MNTWRFNKLNLIKISLTLSVFSLFGSLIYKDHELRSLKNINPIVRPYVRKFLENAEKNNVYLYDEVSDFVIDLDKVRNMNPKFVGYCFFFEQIVAIDDKFWESSDDLARQAVIDHELGHCLLGRMHIDTKEKNGNPESIMFPSVIPSNIYSSNHSYYEKELFSKKTEFGKLPTALIMSGLGNSGLTKDGTCEEDHLKN